MRAPKLENEIKLLLIHLTLGYHLMCCQHVLDHFISFVQAVNPQTWWWWRRHWPRIDHSSGWRRQWRPGGGRSCRWTNCSRWRDGRCESETLPPSSCWPPATGPSSGPSVRPQWRRRTGRCLWREPWTLQFSCCRPGPHWPEPCCTWSGSPSPSDCRETKQRSGSSWRTLKEDDQRTDVCKMGCIVGNVGIQYIWYSL